MAGLSPVDALKTRLGHMAAATALLRENTQILRKELQHLRKGQGPDKGRRPDA